MRLRVGIECRVEPAVVLVFVLVVQDVAFGSGTTLVRACVDWIAACVRCEKCRVLGNLVEIRDGKEEALEAQVVRHAWTESSRAGKEDGLGADHFEGAAAPVEARPVEDAARVERKAVIVRHLIFVELVQVVREIAGIGECVREETRDRVNDTILGGAEPWPACARDCLRDRSSRVETGLRNGGSRILGLVAAWTVGRVALNATSERVATRCSDKAERRSRLRLRAMMSRSDSAPAPGVA